MVHWTPLVFQCSWFNVHGPGLLIRQDSSAAELRAHGSVLKEAHTEFEVSGKFEWSQQPIEAPVGEPGKIGFRVRGGRLVNYLVATTSRSYSYRFAVVD